MMEAKEWRTRDKREYGPGPWQDEPDKMQFADAATGLPCLIVRNLVGALCGYVGVPPGHPLHGNYYYVDADSEGDRRVNDISVHGGLTFAGGCVKDAPEGESVCHVPATGEPDDVWWFGFDCAHAFDLTPALRHYIRAHIPGYGERDTYRDVAYVKREIAQLARQLAAIQ